MTPPLLQVRTLSKSFVTRGGWFAKDRRGFAVRDVSFDVSRGRTFGLVGESGSGKSTLARLLANLTQADHGTIVFDGLRLGNVLGQTHRPLRRRVQIVPQDPASTFDPRMKIGSAIAGPIRLHQLRPPPDIGLRVRDLFHLVGLSPALANRFPHELSGGQLQRLAIARALAVEPDLILLDEVASALDILVKAQILCLLQTLQRDLAMTYVFISHNIADVHLMADSVGVLFSGRLVETGAKDDVFGNPRHPYTRALLSAAMGKDVAASAQGGSARGPGNVSGCQFFGRCHMATSPCQEREPVLSATRRAGHLSACLHEANLPDHGPPSGFVRPLSAQAKLRLDVMAKAVK